MASLRTLVKPNRRAAARFVGQVRRRILRALDERPDVKRTEIADALDVHRSVITRQLNGTSDMSLGRVAELAWALGYEPRLELVDIGSQEAGNSSLAGVRTSVTTGSVSSSGVVKRVSSELVVA